MSSEVSGSWPAGAALPLFAPARTLLRRCAAQLVAERQRWVLWLPVGFGAGISLYFALPVEPAIWIGAAALLAGLLTAVLARRSAAGLPIALGICILCAGFTAAQLRTLAVNAPLLEGRFGPGIVSGEIADIDLRPDGVRIVVERPRLEDLAAADTPHRVRIKLPASAPAFEPGDSVRLLAILSPPPAPAAPGAFDFGRRAYFERLGAVGFAIGSIERQERDGAENGAPARAVAALRHRLAERILQRLPEPLGAVAAALMVGERGAIPEPVMADMRDSGLAHLLAISGLHVGLVAGLLFFAVRGLLALWPRCALNFPIKKWAAVITWFGALGYLLLSGATVPTQRAFLMTSIVLLAVLLDRTAISLRLVAWAAMAVLMLAPESLLSASFQMSFAAVTGLVAAYELRDGRGWRLDSAPALPTRVLLYLFAVCLTSVIAIAATTPFAAYHFNRIAFYGLAANLVAVPVTAFWIMPWALAAFALMPFGLEAWALAPMGWGLALVLAVAREIASWPGAVALVPAAPPLALGLAVAGGLWLCLWRRTWRLLGLLPVAGGALVFALARPPDLLISDDGRLMAVRTPEGELFLSSQRRARFTAELWQRRAGLAAAASWPETGSGADGRLRCDGIGCLYRGEGKVVALLTDERAYGEDCPLADVVLSAEPVPHRLCRGPELVVDRFDVWRAGAHAVWLDEGGLRVETVRARRGERPWARWPQ